MGNLRAVIIWEAYPTSGPVWYAFCVDLAFVQWAQMAQWFVHYSHLQRPSRSLLPRRNVELELRNWVRGFPSSSPRVVGQVGRQLLTRDDTATSIRAVYYYGE
uniref:Uncharacterized protein n=1 Tax=Cacopsylla melanoneura TaxID=428564 RepID=A0A8D8ZCP5_9HEMI